MKILLLNGSPKGEASDTLMLSKAFLDGMGRKYEQIDLIKKSIAPCMGCFSCWKKTPGKCVQRDDAAEMLHKIAGADLVIWSMPLYCYGMPSHVKALVDRLTPLTSNVQITDEGGNTHHETRGKIHARHMLISGCGFPDFEGNFDALVLQFKRLFGKDSPMILCVEAPILNVKEAEPIVLPYFEAIRRAGTEFGSKGTISGETMKFLTKPMLDPNVYRKICSV
ncbi:NADPH-dependent FMN reductase [Ruminococcaceae bacterium BL-4]|nr:NADPH-dependent FMN reductase [Ruminococcaceae bacterium BL-4]